MTTRYRGLDGDIWESHDGAHVTLVEVQDPRDGRLIGTPDCTDVPFADAERIHGLTQIEDGVR